MKNQHVHTLGIFLKDRTCDLNRWCAPDHAYRLVATAPSAKEALALREQTRAFLKNTGLDATHEVVIDRLSRSEAGRRDISEQFYRLDYVERNAIEQKRYREARAGIPESVDEAILLVEKAMARAFYTEETKALASAKRALVKAKGVFLANSGWH